MIELLAVQTEVLLALAVIPSVGATVTFPVEAVAVHPLLSVTWMLYEYVPVAVGCAVLFRVEVACKPAGELDAVHKYVYGVVPPLGVEYKLMVLPRQSLLFDEAVIAGTGFTVTVDVDAVPVQLLPSVTLTV